MTGFLKEHPFISEFKYKWELSVEKKIIMLADAPRIEYNNDNKKDNEIIKEENYNSSKGSLSDFLGASKL